MRKLIVLLAVLALVAAACGGGDDEAELATRAATPTPAAEDAPEPGEENGETPAPGEQPGTGTGDEPEGSVTDPEAVPPAAEPGQPNRPRAGTYVYDLSGQASDPLNPAGPPRSFPDDAEVQSEISWDGDIQTVVTTNSEAPGRTTTRWRWSADRLEFLSIRTQMPGGDFGCVFEPPILAANFPIQTGSLPDQSWGCEDSDGSGETSITIEGQEDVQDANGQTWSTWRVSTSTQFDFGQVRGNQESTSWMSPDLGVDIRSEGSQDGEFGGPVGAQSFASEQQTALKRYPS
jgi:hypothetical protein